MHLGFAPPPLYLLVHQLGICQTMNSFCIRCLNLLAALELLVRLLYSYLAQDYTTHVDQKIHLQTPQRSLQDHAKISMNTYVHPLESYRYTSSIDLPQHRTYSITYVMNIYVSMLVKYF